MAPARVAGYLVDHHPGEQADGRRTGSVLSEREPPDGGLPETGPSKGGWHALKNNEVA